MKTLKRINKDETVFLRVQDHEVNRYLKDDFQFCQKTEWKINVRDAEKAKREEAKEAAKERKRSKKTE
jgi:hypothetical protein